MTSDPHLTRAVRNVLTAAVTSAAILLCPTVAAAGPIASTASAPTPVRLPVPADAVRGEATDINSSGVVVGTVRLATGVDQATVWMPRPDRPGLFQRTVLGQGQAASIDDSGRVAGTSWNDQGTFPTVWHNGTSTVLPGPRVNGHVTTSSTALVAARYFRTSSSDYYDTLVWPSINATPVRISTEPNFTAEGSNDKGALVGQTQSATAVVAVVWRNGQSRRIPSRSGNYSTATAINESGLVVGETSTDRGIRSYLWNGTTMSLLRKGQNLWTRPTDINDLGQVVGVSEEGSVRWASPTAEPTPIPAPADFVAGVAAINNAGSMAGGLTTYETGYPRTWPAVWI